MENEEIRRRLRSANIPLWKLGRELGVTEVTMVRWFREELPQEKRQRILKVIEKLEEERYDERS